MPTITVARVGELTDGQSRTIQGPGKVISVFRSGDSYFAIDDACPHMGASLGSGFVEEGIVTCPWHYWRFRLTDGAWADNPRIKIGIGVVDVKVNKVETPEDIARRIEAAEKAIGPGRVRWIHPDCGFWMLKRSVADRKIAALPKGRDLYLGKSRGSASAVVV